jgi:hypothetical protein
VGRAAGRPAIKKYISGVCNSKGLCREDRRNQPARERGIWAVVRVKVNRLVKMSDVCCQLRAIRMICADVRNYQDVEVAVGL